MNWDRIEDSWKQINGNVTEQWGDLTEEQLDRRIQMICENPDDAEAPEPELTDEEAEAKALAEAIEAERRQFED